MFKDSIITKKDNPDFGDNSELLYIFDSEFITWLAKNGAQKWFKSNGFADNAMAPSRLKCHLHT